MAQTNEVKLKKRLLPCCEEALKKQVEEIISFIETKPALEEGKKYEMWETCYPITVLELIELKKKFLEEKND